MVAWIFCFSTVCTAWLWLRTNNKYECLEEAQAAEHKLYQKRVMKTAVVFCSLSSIFITLHFIFTNLEHDVEVKIVQMSRNTTLESLHSLEQIVQNSTQN